MMMQTEFAAPYSQSQPGSCERWQLVLRHRERLLRIAKRRLPNGYDAEDCVQEALLRCATFERLDDLRMGEFLTSTVVRMCVDYQRRSTRLRLLSVRWSHGEPSQHPEEIASQRSAGRRLLRAADELRGRERQILLARADGLSTAQAATQLGISLKAAEGAFTRGRARLRELCDDRV
jgi:RNA polymerase sigma-70 factor (ECF subfamily)